jgi:hypothetical protein
MHGRNSSLPHGPMDEVRKASRARAPDSPSPGEGRVSRSPANARTWMSGPVRSVAGIIRRFAPHPLHGRPEGRSRRYTA